MSSDRGSDKEMIDEDKKEEQEEPEETVNIFGCRSKTDKDVRRNTDHQA